LPELRISDLVKHIDILEDVKNIAAKIIEKDETLSSEENAMLRQKVKGMFGENITLML
jgi:ATP-dependent DNA helicase RecG